MTIENILILPYHGHEPYLLGTKIALLLGCNRICMPDYYNDVQRSILKKEFSGEENKIYLSPDLGKLIKPLLRDRNDSRNYPEYAADLSTSGHPRSVEQISNKTNMLIEKGLQAISLSGEPHIFTDSHFPVILNLGLPLFCSHKFTYYIFTGRMSDIHLMAPNNTDKQFLPLFRPLGELWQTIEESFRAMFIPLFNALSHANKEDKEVIYTPLLVSSFEKNHHVLKDESVLFVTSGSGVDIEKLHLLSKTIPADFQKVALSHAPKELGIAKQVPSTVYSDDKLRAVFSRGGWGTIWKCLINAKPMGVLDTSFIEDPEIAHSIKTLEKFGGGRIIHHSAQEFLQPHILDACRSAIHDLINKYDTRMSKKKHNSERGIAYITHHIIHDASKDL